MSFVVRSKICVINNEGRIRDRKIGRDRVGSGKVGQGGQLRLVDLGGRVVHEWGGEGDRSRLADARAAQKQTGRLPPTPTLLTLQLPVCQAGLDRRHSLNYMCRMSMAQGTCSKCTLNKKCEVSFLLAVFLRETF